MRSFIFTYKEKKNRDLGLVRNNKVTVSRTTGNIGVDAKAAVGIFISSFGNLKKNEIISIQEVNAYNKPIGEPIKPTDDEAIVPVSKKH